MQRVCSNASSQSFDSVQDGSVAVFTPHTGFKDPFTPAGTPPRESIEVRALVFYEKGCDVGVACSAFCLRIRKEVGRPDTH